MTIWDCPKPGGGGGGGGGTRSEKWWGCAAGRWKLDPKRSREKWNLGPKRSNSVRIGSFNTPKDRFGVGGWEKIPQKDRARSCQSEKRGSTCLHVLESSSLTTYFTLNVCFYAVVYHFMLAIAYIQLSLKRTFPRHFPITKTQAGNCSEIYSMFRHDLHWGFNYILVMLVSGIKFESLAKCVLDDYSVWSLYLCLDSQKCIRVKHQSWWRHQMETFST